MALTTEQLQTLKADIAADPTLSAIPQTPDGAFEIAAAYNLDASPEFIVWKTSVETKQVMENGFVWTAVDQMTAGKARIWEWMSAVGAFNPSKPNVRQGLADAFGASSAMATAILPHCKRAATRAERLFATGTGSDNQPGTMTYEGNLSYADVTAAWNS